MAGRLEGKVYLRERVNATLPTGPSAAATCERLNPAASNAAVGRLSDRALKPPIPSFMNACTKTHIQRLAHLHGRRAAMKVSMSTSVVTHLRVSDGEQEENDREDG